MKNEEIICISIGNAKYFYKANLLSKQAKDISADQPGDIPDGKVREFHATLETTLIYKNGQVAGRTTAENIKTTDEELPHVAAPAQAPAPRIVPSALVKQGKTFVTAYPERVFYIDGIEVARQKLDLDGNVVSSTGAPFSGVGRSFYPNGSLKQESNFENGKFDGEVKTYDGNGRMISIENFKGGLREGESTVFSFTKGILTEQKLEYLKGKLHGSRNSYNLEGKLIGTENFKNGKLEGLRETYFSNGKKSSTVLYKDDKMEGQRIIYYENGNPTYEENYKRGKLEGKRKCYYPDGQLYSEETYKNDKLDGERKVFNNDGKLSARQFYSEGILKENTFVK